MNLYKPTYVQRRKILIPYYVLVFLLNLEQKLQRAVIMLCQKKKTTKLMGLNGTKNIDEFKSCWDELRLVFMPTCKAFSHQKQAKSISPFLLSLSESPPYTFCIYI